MVLVPRSPRSKWSRAAVLAFCTLMASVLALSPVVANGNGGSGTGGPGVPVLDQGRDRLSIAALSNDAKLDPFQRVLSGAGWLRAAGLDPRAQPMPSLEDVHGRQLPASVSGAPSRQAGGGLSVPYRNPAPAFSRNILISRDLGRSPVQLEPHLAVNPKDPDHVVVGVIDYNFNGLVTYVTFDGGETWDGPSQVPYLQTDLIAGGDPVVAFDRNGIPYITFISIGIEEFQVGRFQTAAEISAIAVSLSKDGGRHWSDPETAARSLPVARLTTEPSPTPGETERVRGQIEVPFLDKPWMTVGPDPRDPSKDLVHVSYTEFVKVVEVLYVGELPTFADIEMRSTIKHVTSRDLAQSFAEPLAVSVTVRRASGTAGGPGSGVAQGLLRVVQGSEPHTGTDGLLYVSWMDSTDDDSQEGLAEVYIARSDDGGQTFGRPIRVAVFLEPWFNPRSAPFRYWGTAFPKGAVGPHGEVYLLYGGRNASKPEDDGDIFFVRSNDKGVTWSTPHRLSDDEGTSLQFFPAISVAPDGGLHVMWGDMRDDAVGMRYHIYYTESKDNGDTWGFELKELNLHALDTRVTDFPSNPAKAFPGGQFIGDYFAIASSTKDVYLVWADARLGEYGGSINQKIGFARRRPIAAPEVFISPPTGPGGQEITVQAFNYQPDITATIQVGGQPVAHMRTNIEGRFTAKLFIPVTGEGAQDVVVTDDSGNVGSTSYFTEFGFGTIQKGQVNIQQQLGSLTGSDDGKQPNIATELELLRESVGNNGATWWMILLAASGGAAMASVIILMALGRGRYRTRH